MQPACMHVCNVNVMCDGAGDKHTFSGTNTYTLHTCTVLRTGKPCRVLVFDRVVVGQASLDGQPVDRVRG